MAFSNERIASNDWTGSSPRTYPPRLHPLHGVFLAGSLPLFLGALLSDIAYGLSYQIQWSNFASWLIVGGLIFSGLAMACAIISRFTRSTHAPGYGLYLLLIVITWITGFFNALIHARDAWAMMPTGLILSAVVFLLAFAACWIGVFKFGVGGER